MTTRGTGPGAAQRESLIALIEREWMAWADDEQRRDEGLPGWADTGTLEEMSRRFCERIADAVTPCLADHAADLTREEAAVEILDTLKRWLHPDLDEWEAWRVDEMVGELIDAAVLADPAAGERGAAGELSGYDEFDQLTACPQCKGRGVVTDDHRAAAPDDDGGV